MMTWQFSPASEDTTIEAEDVRSPTMNHVTSLIWYVGTDSWCAANQAHMHHPMHP
jgi:hypothetical protein